MSTQIWSWLLTIVGVTGFFLAGRKVWWCWYINLACQVLWFAYSIVTQQYGFIAGAAIYTIIFSQNAVKWTRDHRRPPSAPPRRIGEITKIEMTESGLYVQGKFDKEKS